MLMTKAQEIATRMANGPRMAIEGTKLTINRLLRQAVEATLGYGIQKEKECMLVSNDTVEALTAFVEKRNPAFTGT
jgi:enoyl-CoA hydratase